MAGQYDDAVLQAWVDAVRNNGVKNSMNKFVGDGVKTVYDINFAGGYLNKADILAYKISPTSAKTDVTVTAVNDNKVTIDAPVEDGWTLVIYRDTPKSFPLVDFADNSIINEKNLDTNFKQTIFGVAELLDRFDETVTFTLDAYAAAERANDSATAAAASEVAAAASATAAAASAASALTSAGSASTNATAVAADRAAVSSAAQQVAADATSASASAGTAVQAANTAVSAAGSASASAASAAASAALAPNLGPQGIVLADKVITGFDATALPDNAWVQLAGRDTVGDGGGGKLRFLKNSTAPANGVTVYAVSGGRLVREGWRASGVNVKWAGGTDAAAIQAAINAAGQNATIVYPGGEYNINASITVIPQQRHVYYGSVFKIASGVQMYVRSEDGYPGRVDFDGIARFEGTGKTGRALSLTNNMPFVRIGDKLHFENFGIPVLLDGSYSSYVGGTYVGNRFGPHLLNECHDTVVNAKSDQNVETAACLNGNPVDGNLGTIPVHNVTFIGYYQNTKHGLWLENCYETRLQNVYHEGNTHSDVKLGVADGGVYGRAAYHTVVDGWQSSSPCASGRNWDVEHAVGANMVGLAFNAGTSSSATVFAVDGYSDQIDVDYQRVQHASIGATAPFSVPAGRVIIRHNGASSFPFTRKYIKLGPVGAEVGALWGTYTAGGRPTVQLESLGSSQDMTFKVQEIERHENAAGDSGFQIDHLNSRTDTAYLFRPATDNLLALGEVNRRWSVVCAGSSSIVTSDARSKTDVLPIPQDWLDAWANVEFVRYKFRDAVATKGDGARWHVGVIAQRVKEAFEERGLDPFEIGILCHDAWDEYEDADGNVHPAGDLYGIRYEEALALECAYLRSKLGAK